MKRGVQEAVRNRASLIAPEAGGEGLTEQEVSSRTQVDRMLGRPQLVDRRAWALIMRRIVLQREVLHQRSRNEEHRLHQTARDIRREQQKWMRA